MLDRSARASVYIVVEVSAFIGVGTFIEITTRYQYSAITQNFMALLIKFLQ